MCAYTNFIKADSDSALDVLSLLWSVTAICWRRQAVCHLVAVGFVATVLPDSEQGQCKRQRLNNRTQEVSAGKVWSFLNT